MYYVDSFMNYLPNRYKNTTGRVMISYDLNFAKFWPKVGPWLGRHRLAAMVENGNTGNWAARIRARILLPLKGSSPDIFNLQNRVVFRYYLDPAKGITTGGFDASQKYPLVFAGDPLPAADASGVTPGLVAISAALRQTPVANADLGDTKLFLERPSRCDYRSAAGQSGDLSWPAADFLPYIDARGIYPDARKFDARDYFPSSRDERTGHTYTHGLVFHAFPWLSLSYNSPTTCCLTPRSATFRAISCRTRKVRVRTTA
ncbi:MAG: hypothetical protein WDM96_19895 [Lacunisphaera sp.]